MNQGHTQVTKKLQSLGYSYAETRRNQGQIGDRLSTRFGGEKYSAISDGSGDQVRSLCMQGKHSTMGYFLSP